MINSTFGDLVAEYDDVLSAEQCKLIIEKFEFDHRKTKGLTATDTEGCLLYTSPSPRDS